MASELAEAIAELDAITRRLRRDCPWDREQDERSIVPHTVEEAYELADAAQQADDVKLADELGDVLFQVHFLSLLLEERDAGSLADVARGATQKLVRRHPHVFAQAHVGGAEDVLRNWDAIKRTEPGRSSEVFSDVPENLPALLYARKLQRRADAAGHSVAPLADAVTERCEELVGAGVGGIDPQQRFEAVGELLFSVVAVSRALRVDPELSLRAASARFRAQALGDAPAASEGQES